MSLVGTRPILQDELLKYELHHRARIAIKPGITGMWQVSGRSDITDFEEVVRLDTEYISIPRFFAKGAAVASVTAELVLVLVYYYMVRKEILLKQVIEMGWKKAICNFRKIYRQRNRE